MKLAALATIAMTVTASAQFSLPDIIMPDYECVLGVETKAGGLICVKADGSVTFPNTIDAAAREFWEGVAKLYPLIRREKCI